ncbi:hypothetical protein C0Q70_04470 [Pomacea canaliculata]|uniref:Uncharacterized protein n=1 Tax=Pomacea canaliculata TaxID=400727 RepID=A0A2T7PIH9_POMCA|nr:hypothetical protein C0Q70_04470 [Pomacea canaliculata]
MSVVAAATAMEKQILIVIATCLAGILFLTSSQASPVPDAVRVRRSSSDQRIAELQALLALTGNGGRVAHGQFDPLRM